VQRGVTARTIGIVQVGAGADGRCALGCQWAVAAKHPGRNGARNDCWPSGGPILLSLPSSPLIHALHCLIVSVSSSGKTLTLPPTAMHEKGDAVQPDAAAGGLHDASQPLSRTCSRSVPGLCAPTHTRTHKHSHTDTHTLLNLRECSSEQCSHAETRSTRWHTDFAMYGCAACSAT
jgi:hypothetical protein